MNPTNNQPENKTDKLHVTNINKFIKNGVPIILTAALAAGAGVTLAVEHGAIPAIEQAVEHWAELDVKATGWQEYHVEEGDTLWKIAKQRYDNSDEFDVNHIVKLIQQYPGNIGKLSEEGTLIAGRDIYIPENLEKN